MDTGIDRLARLAAPSHTSVEQQGAAQRFDAGWALPPLRDYAPGRHSIGPASTRLFARHSRLVAAMAAGLLVWAALGLAEPVWPAPRTAPSLAAGGAMLVLLSLRDLAARTTAGRTRRRTAGRGQRHTG